MEKHFYIFRHGQTDYNIEERLQGQSLNISLNENGIIQANTVADALKDVDIDVIYSSRLKRAYETAEIIAKKNNLNHIVDNRIVEINFGIMEGKTREEIKEKFPIEYDRWHNPDDLEYNFETGENRVEVLSRIDNFFNDVINSNHKNIAMATHGALLKRFLIKIGKAPERIPNCHIFHLVNNDGDWS